MTRLELAARLAIGRELAQNKTAIDSFDIGWNVSFGSALFGAWHSCYPWGDNDAGMVSIRIEAYRLYGGDTR